MYNKELDGIWGLNDAQSCYVRRLQSQIQSFDTKNPKDIDIYQESVGIIKVFRIFNEH